MTAIFKKSFIQVGILAIFYFLHTSFRVVLSPFLSIIEADFAISHTAAGGLFTALSVGLACGLLLTCLLSTLITYRKIIVFATLSLACGFCALSFANTFFIFAIILFITGLCSGSYLPSAQASILSLLEPKNLGKGQAIHELGPACTFIILPLIFIYFMQSGEWRILYRYLASFCALLVLIYLLLGQGGNFKEQKPKISDLKSLNLAFLVLVLMYTVGIMCGFTPFSFLPLYLSEIHGLPIEEANRLLGLSRIIGLFFLALGGLLSDRLGPLKTSTFALILSGIFLLGIGLSSNNTLILCIIIQPLCMAAFFPSVMALISKTLSRSSWGLGIGLLMFVGFTFGSGMAPLGIGFMADQGLFREAFMCMGGVAILIALLGSKVLAAKVVSIQGQTKLDQVKPVD